MCSNINNVYLGPGSANIQIQQGAQGSFQYQRSTSAEVDFDAYAEAIRQILQYEDQFDSIFDDKASQAKAALKDASEAVQVEKNLSKARKALRILKSLAENVAANLVASGIVQVISRLSL